MNNTTGPAGGGVPQGGGGFAMGPSVLPGAMRGVTPEPDGSKVMAVVGLRVPGDIELALLKKATAKALDAARDGLPGRGSVRAIADASHAGASLRIRVELRIEGVGANEEWSRSAEATFADAFVAYLAKRGVEAIHVG